jgi:hypothetical protein
LDADRESGFQIFRVAANAAVVDVILNFRGLSGAKKSSS